MWNPLGIVEGANVFLTMVPLSSITFTAVLSDRGRREGSNTEVV